ncbi:MAG: flagellar biosynthesis protein FlhA [Deltaproteobacteria bacterium]
MSNLRLHLQLGFMTLARRTDIVFAIGAAFVVALLIVPLPTLVLDGLIAVNVGTATVLLVVALMARRALEVSTFPSLLLMTTLFRLGLNVSTTRGILAHADAGEVVRSFGAFVVQGDVVVGGVIFLVITIVQFLVIAKGAERVAEVGARFTLDAMPGKQMSIDASLRSGAYSDEEAQSKREELNRQCQLFGNMDGAMKFVKGDAIAGLIITALNLVAGFIIGVMRFDMPLVDAVETYSILTVGDGLVSQIAALLVTISAGILVTRVEGQDERSNLGNDFRAEVLGSAKVLYVAAFLMISLALVPGLPFFPFAAMAMLLAAVASGPALMASMETRRPKTKTEVRVLRAQQATREAATKKRDAREDEPPCVVPISLDLGDDLSRALGFTDDDVGGSELLDTYIPQLRQALHRDTGVQIPGIRVQTYTRSVPRSAFCLRIMDVPALEMEVRTDKLLALAEPRRLARLGVDTEPTPHPMGGDDVALIAHEDRRVAEAAGVQVWSPSGVVALHVGSVLRDEAKTFVGVHEVSQMLKRVEKIYPELVRESVPKLVSVAQLVEILRRVVDEGVCIRDFKTILEVIAENGAYETDGVALTELVRAGLARQIANRYAGLSNRLPVVLLDPIIEETIESGIHQSLRGCVLSLDPEISKSIVLSVARALEPMLTRGTPPVILTSAKVRRLVRKIIEIDLPEVPVLSFEELPPKLVVQPMGRASIAEA